MEKDISWKECFSDNARYADVINGIGCGGKQAVRAGDLQELDTQERLGHKNNTIREQKPKKAKKRNSQIEGYKRVSNGCPAGV